MNTQDKKAYKAAQDDPELAAINEPEDSLTHDH